MSSDMMANFGDAGFNVSLRRQVSGAEVSETTVTAKCIQCGHKREIKAHEVPHGDMPTCDKCWGIMVAVKAQKSSRKEPRRWFGPC